MIVLIVSIIKKIAMKNILFHLCRTFILACLLFIFCHTTILSLLLLANRINNKGTEIKHYKIIYITNDKYLSAFNINNDKDIIDQNDYLKYSVKDKIDNLTVGDTISIEMQKGLFGVNYFNAPQMKYAVANYGGMKNKDKIRLQSVAQYGLTMFWKEVNIIKP